MNRALVVDDHPDNRYYLEVLLGGCGYEVESAANGVEALAKARAQLPDLVICDLLMPIMDGYTLLRHWKQDNRLKLVPFVVYTATYTSAEDQQLAMQLGADAFLLKPAEPELLLQCIQNVRSRMTPELPATRVPIGDEHALMTLYSETLVRKLEEKTARLEQELRERRVFEDAFRASEARLLTAQRVGKMGSWETEIATGAVTWSAQLHVIFETDSALFSPTHEAFLQRVHPDDRERVSQAFDASLLSGTPCSIQHRLLLPGGRIKHVEECWEACFDDHGQPVQAIGTCRDISEQKQAELQIRRSSELLHAVADGTPDAVFVKDRAGRYLLFNDGAARLVGRAANDVVGHDDSAIFGTDDVAQIRANDQRVMESNQVQSAEEVLTAGGVTRTYMATKAPYRDSEGQVIGIIGISRDISERRAMEVALRQTLLDLDNRNRLLRDFAFVASHDLREPLRKIRTFSDILMSRYLSDMPEPAQTYLQRLNHTAARMQVLIEDVLTYSRITAGKDATQQVDLTTICGDALADLEDAVLACGAQISVSTLPFIRADPTQMRQLFQNLLSNALKFRAPDRRLLIQVSCEPITWPVGPGIRLQFRDNGIGFSNEWAERIFEPFQQLHTHARFDGSGIGLAIVSRIVDRHGGSILAEGSPDHGACFTVILPHSGPNENHSHAPAN